MLGTLFTTVSNSQRDDFTADDLVGPLDLLFEFGELDCHFPPDPNLRPRVLVGNAIQKCFGVSNSIYKYKEELISDNLYFLIESSEPSTGLRYFITI